MAHQNSVETVIECVHKLRARGRPEEEIKFALKNALHKYGYLFTKMKWEKKAERRVIKASP